MSAFDKDVGDILAKSRHEAAVAAARDQELSFMADQIEQAKARELNTQKILTETRRGADDLKRQRYEQDMRFAELTKQCQDLEAQLAERSDELEKAYIQLKGYQLASNKQAATIEELKTEAKELPIGQVFAVMDEMPPQAVSPQLDERELWLVKEYVEHFLASGERAKTSVEVARALGDHVNDLIAAMK